MAFKKTIFLHDKTGNYQYFKHFIFKNDISKDEILKLIEEWLTSLYPEYPDVQEYIKNYVMKDPMVFIDCLHGNELCAMIFEEKFLELSRKNNFEDPLDFLLFLNFEKAFPSFIEYLEDNGYGINPIKDFKLIQ